MELALPFDTDAPEFARGVEMGMLWEALKRDGRVSRTVHASNAEMIIRIAEAAGLPFRAEPLAAEWLHAEIGPGGDG